MLRAHPEIVVTAGYADRHEPALASRSAPPAVADPERIGFADMDLDPDGVLRRGLLYLTGGEGPGTSLALRLALRAWRPPGSRPSATARICGSAPRPMCRSAPTTAATRGSSRAATSSC